MHHTLIVADDISYFDNTDLNVVTFEDYLADFPKLNEPKTRVINLCDTGKYLSQGYYCSLLAQARQHRVLPAVNIINDLRMTDEGEGKPRLPLPEAFSLPGGVHSAHTIYVLFGQTKDQAFSPIAEMAFKYYPCPILKLTLHIAEESTGASQHSPIGMVELEAAGFNALPESLRDYAISSVRDYATSTWKGRPKSRKTRWDMAILVNPEEVTPPSDKRAISQFVKAAEAQGIHAEVVSRLSVDEVGHYDALFIRETTAIDHHTYRLARAAEREGLVVIDDTQSILRCCNKVFLQDAFAYQKVPAPKSQFVASDSDEDCARLISELGLPLVLKLPESSFSRGVYKVEDAAALKLRLQDMLAESALVLVQEYVYTEYDWRIGVLGGKPIYACKYYMARNHWQIYNHKDNDIDSGGFTTMPTFEVPKPVLQAAVKAAKAVGEGLYGVDIKHTGNKVYVIEVNDNPSIDSGVEDKYLGRDLYTLIMQEFVKRLEQRGR
ncbi:RimK family protein [Salinimonas lutimaris]|uniref:RimK family protein n=1 Tax=Salinimonas lutimaris TaxID=914153 RepID=UPI0010BF852D|nr:RimK family protein [Salinimonas lutimaris]